MRVILLFCLVLYFSCNRTLSQNLFLEPQKPSSDGVSFSYDPSPPFNDSTRLNCVVYFSGATKRMEQDFPKAKVIGMEWRDGKWLGKIDSIPVHATGFVITFADWLGNRDDNNGRGYWSLIYENNEPLPGGWSGIGDLLYGNWDPKICSFFLTNNPDSSRRFFLRDFAAHPEMKRIYMRQYLATWKINGVEEERNFRNELESLELPDLVESELQALRSNYLRIGDTVNSNRIERQLFKKFPKGPWYVQSKSLSLLAGIGTTKDFEKQKALYKQFKDLYFKPFPDEYTNRVVNGRMAQMLSYMVSHFVEEENLEQWLQEVDQLQDEFKCAAYKQAAWELLGIKGRGKPLSAESTFSEHPFFISNLGESRKSTKAAEVLSQKAVDLWKNMYSDPRRWNETPVLTDKEVAKFREMKMSEFLEVWGISKMNGHKLEDAIAPLTKAVQLNGFEDSSINQTYIEVLVKAGRFDLALTEMEKIMGKNKSTPALDSFYSGFKKEKQLSAVRNRSIENAKGKLRSKMIHERAPAIICYDTGGKKVSASATRNKIVVVEIWASWCPPCLEGLKSIELVSTNHKNDAGIVFLRLNADNSVERALRVVERFQNKSQFVFDHDHQIVKQLGVSGLPTQLVIDRNGVIRFRSVGLSSYNVQENAITLEAMIELVRERSN